MNRRSCDRMSTKVRAFKGYLSTLYLLEGCIVVEVDMRTLSPTETLLPSSMLLTIEYTDIDRIDIQDSKLLIYTKSSDRPISLILENAREAAMEIMKRISSTGTLL